MAVKDNSGHVINPYDFFLTTLGNRYTDYKRVYLFKAIFPALPNTDSAMVTYFVAETATPEETTEKIDVAWRNSDTKIGGRTNYGTWTVTMRDDHKNTVHNYMKVWKNMVYDRDAGTSEIPALYKMSVSLELLHENGETLQQYMMKGAFPVKIGASTLNHATNEIITFPVDFEYDMFNNITQ